MFSSATGDIQLPRHRPCLNIPDFKGKSATVMGLGLFGGGLGVVKYLVGKGAKVTVTDLKDESQLKESVDALKGLPIKWKLGGHEEEDFKGVDFVIFNPAVPKDSEYVKIAQKSGAFLETEMNLFFKGCKGRIIGVTGTSGKTTTTSMIGKILKEWDPGTSVGGNVGESLLEQMESIGRNTPVVLELSSFQLERLRAIALSPQLSVVTNISTNHIDWHRSMEAYIEAKRSIVLNQNEGDVALLNYDDDTLRKWEDCCPGDVLFFSVESALGRGVYVKDNFIRARIDREELEICRYDELKIPGVHNLQNALAAVGVALSFGVDVETVARVLGEFEGVEHRLEFVRTLNDVEYYNDSIATTPERTVTALKSIQRPVLLIAGGYDKGIPFEGLAKVISKRVKVLLLIGDAAQQIAQSVQRENRDLSLIFCQSLKDAVLVAQKRAEKGDAVLLSPACASYDMFRNFQDRGNIFKEIVKGL